MSDSRRHINIKRIPKVIGGGVTHFRSSFYADDGAFLFATRDELEACVPIIHTHFKRFGLLMHVGTADKASKTECMYYPPHRNDVITADDTAAVAADEEGSFVHVQKSMCFKVYMRAGLTADLYHPGQ